MLGLSPGAGRREIKRAYHRLARENHPDLFPAEQKPFQELKMITLNEAYAYLLEAGEGEAEPAEEAEARRDGSGRAGEQAPEWSAPPRPAGRAETASAVGFHRDPPYAYYKQGFRHYSRALHGIAALYQSIARYHRIHFNPRDDAYERFAGSLVELRRAHEYFCRVEQEFPQSMWVHDARLKLTRIERFSELYRRIIRNLTGSEPAP